MAPTNGAKGVSRATNVVATFSEAMDSTTLSKTNVKLYKVTSKSTTEITNVRSLLAPTGRGPRSTLTVLRHRAGEEHHLQALVSTGARDLAAIPWTRTRGQG